MILRLIDIYKLMNICIEMIELLELPLQSLHNCNSKKIKVKVRKKDYKI